MPGYTDRRDNRHRDRSQLYRWLRQRGMYDQGQQCRLMRRCIRRWRWWSVRRGAGYHRDPSLVPTRKFSLAGIADVSVLRFPAISPHLLVVSTPAPWAHLSPHTRALRVMLPHYLVVSVSHPALGQHTDVPAQTMTLDITLCGDWAGAVIADTCPALVGTNTWYVIDFVIETRAYHQATPPT